MVKKFHKDGCVKVLFVNPPRENEIVGNNPAIIDEERGYNPPLGLLYVAAYLLEHTAHEVEIIDCQVEGLSYHELENRIRASRPDVLGLTAMTLTLIDVLKTARAAKEIDPSTMVVLGGPHVSIYPQETISYPGVDFAVSGEGEQSFKMLLDALGDEKAIAGIPGIGFKKKDGTLHASPPSMIEDLDALPFPARRRVPYQKYSSLLMKRNPVTTIMTSRGCPFKCSFCDRPFLMNYFRPRSVHNVIAEIEDCISLGIHDFLFYDDTFTVNKQRVVQICKEIVDRNWDIRFDVRSRVDTVSEEVLLNLKKAGCMGIHYGVEAGTEKILKVLKKGTPLEQIKETFALTKRVGIPILAYFIIGNPSETLDDIHSTFKLIRELDPDYLHLSIFIPFPGSEIYINGLEKGLVKCDHWKEFAQNPQPGFLPPHWDEFFSREDLNILLTKGYKEFYLRPSYIMKKAMRVNSWEELKKNFRAGLKVFGMK